MLRTTSIVTAPSATDLTTLGTVKDALNLAEDDASSDVFLARAIRAASDWACNYTGRTFAQHTRQDVFRLSSQIGGATEAQYNAGRVRNVAPLTLSHDRLDPSAVTSVVVSNATLDPATYYVEGEPGLIWRVSSSGVAVQWIGLMIEITYQAGWTTPSSHLGTWWTLPASVEDAVIDRVCTLYAERGRNRAIARERVEGVGDIYYNLGSTISDGDVRLDPYRLRQD